MFLPKRIKVDTSGLVEIWDPQLGMIELYDRGKHIMTYPDYIDYKDCGDYIEFKNNMLIGTLVKMWRYFRHTILKG